MFWFPQQCVKLMRQRGAARRLLACGCNLLSMALLLTLLTACFLTDVLPKEKKQSPAISIPKPAPPPPAPAGDIPVLSGSVLLRRISLDIRGKLPLASELSSLESGEVTHGDLVDQWGMEDSAAETLAQAHRLIWRFNGLRLPDLERFSPNGQVTLTESLRTEIIDEPLHTLRRSLEEGEAYGAFFKAGSILASPDVLGLYGLTLGEELFLGVFQSTWDDNRPSMGILTSPGLLGAVPGEASSLSRGRTASLMSRLLCVNLESRTAHVFTGLTDAEMAQLHVTALTLKQCASCHASIDRVAGAFSGTGDQDSLASWLSWEAPTGPWTFGGQSFDTPEGVAEAFAEDARLRNCASRGLFSTMVQRPAFGDLDAKSLAAANRDFDMAGQDFRILAVSLTRSREYRLTPAPRDVPANKSLRSSGLRLLSRRHWMGIWNQLLPESSWSQLSFPEELDPGIEEAAGTTWRIPSGSWWMHVNQLVHDATEQLVSVELADSSTSSDRRLLTLLPEGPAVNLDDAVLTAQISAAWKFLSGAEINEASLVSYKNIFATAGGSFDAETSRASWKAVLTAMLLSPGVLSL